MRIGLGILLGEIIGVERQRSGNWKGFGTHVIVAIGATVSTLLKLSHKAVWICKVCHC